MRKTILLFETDASVADELVAALLPLADAVEAVVARDGDDARRRLAGPIDLLLVDLDAPLLDGFALAARALSEKPGLPLLVLAAVEGPRVSRDLERGQFRALTKPVDAEALREAIVDLLPGATHGHLAGVSVAGVLQLLSLERRSGVVLLELPDGPGRLVVEEGQLVDAEAAGVRGEEAVFRLVDWLARPAPEILLEELGRAPERTIHRSLDGVLLDATRRRDESARGDET